MILNTKIRYTQFDADQLGSYLKDLYHLNEIASCKFYDMGLNDIYKVQTSDQVLYYRISLARMHQLRDYEQEVQAILELARQGISVAKPLPMTDGHYVLQLEAPEGIRFGVLFEEAKQNPGEDVCKQIELLGQNLALIHKVSDQEKLQATRDEIDLCALYEQPLQRIKQHLEHRNHDYEYLAASGKQITAFVQEHLSKKAPYYGFCHGDLHSGNVHFDGDLPVIFDFDCMGYGYRAYDVCIFAWNECYSNPDYMKSEQWAAFLRGYENIRKLSSEEKACIIPFMALRQIWLMGLHSDMMNKNAGCCWYNDGYFDEQIGLFKRYYEQFKG